MKKTQIKSDVRQFKNVYILIFVLLLGSVINIYIKLFTNVNFQIDKHTLDTTQSKKRKHEQLKDILEFVRIQNINQTQVINIKSMRGKNSAVTANKYKNDNIDEKQTNKRPNGGQTGKQARKQKLSVEQLNRLVQERVQMGQPRSKPRKIRALIVKNKQFTNNCGFINAINIMTPITVESATKLLNVYNVGNIVFFVDQLDQFAMDAFRTNFKDYNIMAADLEFDADYHFINNLITMCKCEKIIYIGHNIKILDNPNGNKQTLSNRQSMLVQYSNNALQNNNQISLQDLAKIDLRKMKAQQLNKYLFIFDSRYFKFITPLNFAYFAKYTLEEMLVVPVLALAQRINRIRPFHTVMHQFNETQVHFKNFQLYQPQQQTSSYCLVSYTSDPEKQSFEQTITYLKSIFELNLTNLSVSVIIFLPYHSSISQYEYIIKLSELILNRPEVSRFRFRFQQNRAVSSLSIYQSSHVFCPTKSIIVSSRHNIIFETESLQIISKHIQPQNKYIIAGFSNEGNTIKLPNTNILEWKNDLKRSIQIYNQYLQHFQIFSTDLAKNYHLWLLKSAQLQFYESQAAFAIPFLQMAKSIEIINQSIFTVSKRKSSQIEQKQLKNIEKLARADKKIKSHEINYNSLQNQAFQQFQQNRIPKIIHIMSEFAVSTEQNLKKINPQFQVLRWSQENINQIEFPLCYSLFVRLMQYSKSVQQPKIQVFAYKLIAFEALYNHGGIYLDRKVKVNRQLSAFLKYDLFFDSYVPADQPYIGHNIMGFSKHNYFLKILITEVLILKNIELTSGWKMNIGSMLAKVMNQYQLFTKAGFGGNLFYNTALDNRECPLSQQNQPCDDYPDAYAYFYDTSQNS